MDLPQLDVPYIIVDQSKYSRTSIEQMLAHRGFTNVRTTDNCEHALTMMAQEPAEIMIVDWDFDSVSMELFCNAIRDLDHNNDRYTGIIISIADEDEDILLDAFKHDVNDFVCKPIREFELITRINSVLHVVESRRTLEKKLFYIEQLNRLLVQKNVIDPLTQLGNKNYLMRELENQILDVFKRGGGFNLSIIEVVSQKTLDNNAVKIVSQRIRDAIRPSDPLCRIDDSRYAVAKK